MQDDDLTHIVFLAALAREPVFVSFKNVLGSTIFTRMDSGWRVDQA